MRTFPSFRPRLPFAAVLLAGLVAVTPASAQGYGLYEHGACAMARAGTGVADPCADGSAVFFNPAGLALPRGQAALSVGGTLLAPSGGFTNSITGRVSELNNRVFPVPTAYYVRGLTDRVTIAAGLFAPYGLETDWPETSEGRFLGYKSKVQSIYLQPTVAYRLNERWSIGGGVDVSFVSVELRQRLDLAEQLVPGGGGATFGNLGIAAGTDFADVGLTGSARGVGYHLGVRFQANARLALGARFLSRQRIEVDNGSVVIDPVATGLVLAQGNPFGAPAGTPMDALLAPQFADGAPLSDQGGSAVLRFPEQLVVGLAYQASDRLKLLGDVQYTNWWVFQTLPLRFDRLGTVTLIEDFRATYGFRFGGEFRLKPGTTLRAGYLFHGAAAPDQTVTPNLPEGPRDEWTLGFGTGVARRLTLDLAYQYIDQADRQGRSTDGGLARPTAAVNNGLYTFKAHLVGLSLTYAF